MAPPAPATPTLGGGGVPKLLGGRFTLDHSVPHARRKSPYGGPLLSRDKVVSMATANKREAFCLTYFSLPDERGRGRRAAVAVGYSEKTASVTASRLLADPGIQERLKELAIAKLNGTSPPLPGQRTMPAQPGAHPSETGRWPFSPPGANHSAPAEDAPSTDPFDGEQIADPKDFLRKAMNNPRLDPKLRVDAAKKLIDFEHAKLGEVGKKEQKQEAAKTAGGGKFATSAPPRLAAAGGKSV